MADHLIKGLIKGSIYRFHKIKDTLQGKNTGISFFTEKKLKHEGKSSEFKKINSAWGEIFYKDGPELYHCLHEIFYEKIYLQDIPANAKIIDCGGNIGISALYFHKAQPTANIQVFEPDDTNFEVLTKNIEHWKCASQVKIIKKAIWIEEGEISFQSEGTLNGHITKSENDQSQITSKKVPCVRLKKLLTENIYFLKIDIEGAEFDVLMDCKDNLSFVQNLFLEYHGKFDQNNQLNEILQLLTSSGFSYYIKEAGNVYPSPFKRDLDDKPRLYDVQLNIFAFRSTNKQDAQS